MNRQNKLQMESSVMEEIRQIENMKVGGREHVPKLDGLA